MAKAIEITPDLIARAADLARQGLPNKSIAAGIGISEWTFYEWLRAATEGTGNDSHTQFSQAIQAAAVEAEQALVAKLSAGDERSATWLLTHSPRWRDTWSDASATRREVHKVLTGVVETIETAPGLSDEQRRQILLSLAARGFNASEQ